MTLNQFRDVLLTVTDKVYQFEAMGDAEQEHIVWQETGGRALYGDGKRQERIGQLQVELYTKEPETPLLEMLLKALEEADVAFEEPVPDYERETGFIRHIIECEVIGWRG